MADDKKQPNMRLRNTLIIFALFLAAVLVGLYVYRAGREQPFEAKPKEEKFERSWKQGQKPEITRLLVKFKGNVAEGKKKEIAGKHNLKEAGNINQLGVRILTISADDTAEEALDRLKAQDKDSIEYAELDDAYPVHLTPNDPSFSGQWNLFKVNAPQAWDKTTGSASLILADLDTGIDYNHPEFVGKVILGPDYVNGDNDPKDDHGHGTATASTAAANTNNSYGMAGVDWLVKVLVVKVCDATAWCYWSNVTQGITYAADQGAKAINISLGGTSGSSAMQSALQYALSKGAVSACSTGNSGSQVAYPAAYPECIAVGATDSGDNRTSWSNYGDTLDLMAPGSGQTVAQPGGGFSTWQGTSFSAPHVTGLATLLRAVNPSLSASQVRNIMQSTAKDLGTAGWDQYYGWGRIDAAAAVAAAGSPPSDTQPPTAPSNLTGSAPDSTKVNLSWTASTDNVGVTGYQVYRDNFQIATTTATTYTDSTVTAGTNYSYFVKAYDAAGNVSGASNTVTVSVPQSVTTLTISSYQVASKTNTTATITWTTNLASTGTVFYGTDPNNLSLSAASTTSGTSHSVTLSGLTPKSRYYYQIRAQTSDGKTATSPVTSFRTKPR